MDRSGVAAVSAAPAYDATNEEGIHGAAAFATLDSSRISRVHPSPPSNPSPTKAIDFDRFYGDGSFLKLLQETLQKNADVLKQGVLKLALSPVAIAYLNDRLHTTLCPKSATDNSGRIDGWTIRRTTNSQSFRYVLSPRKSVGFSDSDAAPVGHLDVLKLSTLLAEPTCVKVTGTPDQALVHFNIFPSLKRIELYRMSVAALEQLACFVAQLEVLQLVECVMQSPLDVLRHGAAWTTLTSLKIVQSDLREWFPDEMMRVPALQHLDCSNNRLSQLHSLPARTSLQVAILSHNRHKVLALSESYPKLTWLALDHNAFESLRALPWSNLPNLQHLDASFNALHDLAQVSVLSQLKHLRTLKLLGNPIAAFPDYRRQVLFYLGDAIELDDVPWTWTELDSMRFSRHNKGTTGPLAYPRLPPKPMQMQPRVVKIQEPRAPYHSMIRKPRAQSAAFSEVSMVSSLDRTSVASESEVPMSPASARGRAVSYHVDEFLRDLADEEAPDTDDLHPLYPPAELEHVMPPTTPGIVATIFLSMEQADSLDLPLSREGVSGLVHITPTKLMEYLPGGGVIQRHRSHLLCMAVITATDSNQKTIQLGFRHRPTVAYKVSDTAAAVKLVRAMHETLAEKPPMVAFKCRACGALVVSREKQTKVKAEVPLVLTVHQCWICKSSNGRDYATDHIPQCYLDLGLDAVDAAPPTRAPPDADHTGFYLDAEYDDVVEGRDEIIWVVTDTFMKEVKLCAQEAAPDDDNGSADAMAYYRAVCGM